ncbi:PQQ-like beta-propeller repeat protein [Candidatus Micrarchaeota archaeon]|nr:PQQ-like beta-propeller repeat protein [Candidatus Micrarchaeota archaeon]
MRFLILFLLLVSLPFAEIAGETELAKPLTTKPLVAGVYNIIGAEDGRLYAEANGIIKWKYYGLHTITVDPILHKGNIIGASGSKLFSLKQIGTFQWAQELSNIYGIDSGDKIYVSTEKGLYAISDAGKVAWCFETEKSTATEPTVSASYIIYGTEDSLYVLRSNGELFHSIPSEGFWNVKPLIYKNRIYIGSVDGRFHSYDLFSGEERWSFDALYPIVTNAVNHGSTIIFADEKTVYAVLSGEEKWRFDVGEQVVNKKLEIGMVSGKTLLFVTTRNSIYVLDAGTGQFLTKITFDEWPTSPTLDSQKGILLVGSKDGVLYSFNVNRGCGITNPKQEAVLGFRELEVEGVAYSAKGDFETFVRINEGEWFSVGSENAFSFEMDPKDYAFGSVEIECRVTDSSGEEQSPYSKVRFIRSSSIEEEEFVITYPTVVNEGEPFTVHVTDQYNQTLKEVEVVFGEDSFIGDSSIEATLYGGGEHAGVVKKQGFEDKEFSVEVRPSAFPAYVAFGLFSIGLIVFVFNFFIKKKEE